MYPDEAEWGLHEHLTALTADLMNVLAWQNGGGKKQDYPKPIPRPGIESDQTYGKKPIPIDEMAEWLGWEQ